MDWPPPESEPPVTFHRVAALRDLREGQGRAFWIGTRRVALFRSGGATYATSNTCPHAGGSLAHGRLTGTTIECPVHQWCFDVRTGDCPEHDIYFLRTYAVEIRDGDVWVGLPDDAW